jgi:hypothetical protein
VVDTSIYMTDRSISVSDTTQTLAILQLDISQIPVRHLSDRCWTSVRSHQVTKIPVRHWSDIGHRSVSQTLVRHYRKPSDSSNTSVRYKGDTDQTTIRYRSDTSQMQV